jgi:hypothetical protein
VTARPSASSKVGAAYGGATPATRKQSRSRHRTRSDARSVQSEHPSTSCTSRCRAM